MKEKPTTRILKAARALIARRGGWYKGYYFDSTTGAVCALGAINKAATGNPCNWSKNGKPVVGVNRAYGLLAKAAGAKYVPDWNDRSRTRKKDVLEAFDKAI